MDYYSTYLLHYGVKGMRWGHRKHREKVNSAHTKKLETEEEIQRKRKERIKRNVIIGSSAVGILTAALAAKYAYRKLNRPVHFSLYSFGKTINLNDLPDADEVIKPSKFYRMSSKPFEEYEESGRAYVSTLFRDRILYKEIMPDHFKDWALNGIIQDGSTVYEHTIKTKKPIKVASKRKVAEVYLKATGNDHIDQGAYKTFMENLVDKNNSEVKSFFNGLRKLGYDAIIDEHDEGYSRKPLILINPKEIIERSKSHKVRGVEKVINTILL